MDRRDFLDKVSLYLLGELDAEKTREMEAYLAAHPEERSELEQTSPVLQSLDAHLTQPRLDQRVPEHILSRVTEASQDAEPLDPVAASLRWTIAFALMLGAGTMIAAILDPGPSFHLGQVVMTLTTIALGGTFLLGAWTLPRGRREQLVGRLGISPSGT